MPKRRRPGRKSQDTADQTLAESGFALRASELDEFYSHFIYTAEGAPGGGPVSATAHIDDVDEDPVLLVDGLTRRFRYPGWRLGWVVGPRAMIDGLGRATSAIDGGPSRVVQRAALEVLQPERADQETDALRKLFADKRRLMLDTLTLGPCLRFVTMMRRLLISEYRSRDERRARFCPRHDRPHRPLPSQPYREA